MTKIAKAVEEFAKFLACRPHDWVLVNNGKPDKFGGVARRCTKCKVRETSYPDGVRKCPKRPNVKARR